MSSRSRLGVEDCRCSNNKSLLVFRYPSGNQQEPLLKRVVLPNLPNPNTKKSSSSEANCTRGSETGGEVVTIVVAEPVDVLDAGEVANFGRGEAANSRGRRAPRAHGLASEPPRVMLRDADVD